jgi:phosphonopyruvate decarboxylase
MHELSLTRVAQELLARSPDSIVVASCGYTSRELFEAGDRPGNLYLVGSMGMAAPIALGLALSRPDQDVIAIDGDGSLLMNLGALPLVGSASARILHVVVDNGMHESTGGQATVQRANFTALALAAGYADAVRVESAAELVAADLSMRPVLLHAVVAPRGGRALRRVTHSPQEMVRRVRRALDYAGLPENQRGVGG